MTSLCQRKFTQKWIPAKKKIYGSILLKGMNFVASSRQCMAVGWPSSALLQPRQGPDSAWLWVDPQVHCCSPGRVQTVHGYGLILKCTAAARVGSRQCMAVGWPSSALLQPRQGPYSAWLWIDPQLHCCNTGRVQTVHGCGLTLGCTAAARVGSR